MKCSPVPPTRTSGWWSGCSPSLPSSSRPGCGTRAAGWPTGSPSCTSGPSTVMMTYWAAPRPSRSSRRSSASGRPASRWRAGRASSEATAPHRGSPPGLLGGCVSGFDATLMPVPILVPTTSDGGEGCTSVTTAGPTRSARTCTSDPDHRTQVDLGRSYPVVGWASKISAWWLWWDAGWGWPVTTSPVDQFAVAPDPGVARTVDELIERLRSLKVWAGDPSYEAITDRINAAWAAAGRAGPPGYRRRLFQARPPAAQHRPGRRRGPRAESGRGLRRPVASGAARGAGGDLGGGAGPGAGPAARRRGRVHRPVQGTGPAAGRAAAPGRGGRRRGDLGDRGHGRGREDATGRARRARPRRRAAVRPGAVRQPARLPPRPDPAARRPGGRAGQLPAPAGRPRPGDPA